MGKTINKQKHKSSQKNKSSSITRTITIAIIILAMIIVVTFIILTIVFSKENIIKSEINDIATDYYENHLYEKYASPDGSTNNLNKYEENGINHIPLRQLLYSNKDYKEKAESILKYCDENKTFIKYYPDSPFSKTSYHIEYTYSCNFE